MHWILLPTLALSLAIAGVLGGCQERTPLEQAKAKLREAKEINVQVIRLAQRFKQEVRAFEEASESSRQEISLRLDVWYEKFANLRGSGKRVLDEIDSLIESPEGAYITEQDREFIERSIAEGGKELRESLATEPSWDDMERYLQVGSAVKEIKALSTTDIDAMIGAFIDRLESENLVTTFRNRGDRTDTRVMQIATEIADLQTESFEASLAVIDLLTAFPHGRVLVAPVNNGYGPEVAAMIYRASTAQLTKLLDLARREAGTVTREESMSK